MSRLWKTVKAWRLRRQQFSPDRWAKVRAKGKRLFILRQTFSYTVYAVALYDLGSQFFHYNHPFKFGFYIFQFAFTGIWCGYGLWVDQEGKYKAALKSPSQKSFQPH